MKRLHKICLFLFLTAVVFLAVQPEAEAVRVTLNNRRGKTVSTALLYYDVNEGLWCCQGWWNVKPYSRRSIHVPHHPNSDIYYYVMEKGRSIYKRAPKWSRWHVINNAFKYYEGDGCPYGKNPRAVYFNGSSTVTGDSWTLNLN